jgi:hypothetical protein
MKKIVWTLESAKRLREIIVKKYRIVYRIKHDCIEILTVFESHHLLRISEIFSED